MKVLSTQDQLLGTAVVLPRVNLLPPEIASRRRFRRVQAGMGGGVLAAVAVVGVLFLAAGSGVSDAESEVQAAQTEQTRLTTESAKFREVTATYAQAAQAEQLLVQAMGAEVRYSRLMNELSLLIPEKVWITEVSFAQASSAAADGTGAPGTGALGAVTFGGMASQHDDVATWLEALAAQQGFADVTLSSSTAELIGKRPFVKWSSTVDLGPLALSGRYVPAGS